MNMKGLSQMNARIFVIPLVAALVGGCAWLNEPYHYVDERCVEPFYTTPTVIAVPGGRPVIARRPVYTRYSGRSDRDWYDRDRRRRRDTPENRALRTLQREAHEEREFIRDVGKAQMKMQRDAVKMQVKTEQAKVQMQMDAAKAQAKMQQQQAQAQIKMKQQQAKMQMEAAKAQMKAQAQMERAKMKAAARMMK